MKRYFEPQQSLWKEIAERPAANDEQLRKTVGDILLNVKRDGDAALIQYTTQFDGRIATNLKVPQKEIDESEMLLSVPLKNAIDQAMKNITAFHEAAVDESQPVYTMSGIKCWSKRTPVEKVGFYIPGGRAPLFSTLLMLGIPARIAGCKEIIVCSPPGEGGSIHPAILYTARKLGISNIFSVGGAQAIAAMGYGTETIPAVYKIFGPGNSYVTMAKQLLQTDGLAIDMPAGPSELAILADDTCVPAWVAADLLSQAEHGQDSQLLLIANSDKTAGKILDQLSASVKDSNDEIAATALSSGSVVIMKDLLDAIKLINYYAPEHLILACSDAIKLAEQISNAGSVFIGNYSAESAGDYATGPNHVLPTAGFAKAFSGVSVESFQKRISFQELTAKGLETIAETVIEMAEAEGLQFHADAIKIRVKSND